MRKTIFVIVVTALILVLATGCEPGTVLQTNTPETTSQAGTPIPAGQIDVPGFKIQLYAPGLNPLVNTANEQGRTSGIGIGIWHGIISPVTLVMSFINPNVQIYEVHNDGNQYNAGFLLGVAIIFLLLGVTAGRRRR